ncbi:methylated-DNA--[protein]-cysteine S-methyltransferase [Ureibacillus sinduriensis]|uniref:methylated-DNA--[protein]-cysteine S-methyltransferase n=1 Tax=Ureibacillus sinduriensis BLB-1 = JCM 15800 TaxID=1384057 RepID=A0A0A3HQK7_9BACL|nr:methylated-DNA--[protein]-cysteine S-methyltransferase [Ureibacillus sinduriensis]KGR74684.1 cysteine methyltransferase [Ureibacillus sinduriensis BLB-1 = JCM 15800]
MDNRTLIYYQILLHNQWKVYLAATENGLCYLGTEHSSLDELKRVCKKQYPNCELLEAVDELSLYTGQLEEYFDGSRTQFTFNFDVRGTIFQMNVWKALNSIPYGKTFCYSDIANKIGNPKAVRAVGTAIGSNPVAIAIPCHRVLGKNGSLTGFSGGLDVKEKLLTLEKIPYK